MSSIYVFLMRTPVLAVLYKYKQANSQQRRHGDQEVVIKTVMNSTKRTNQQRLKSINQVILLKIDSSSYSINGRM